MASQRVQFTHKLIKLPVHILYYLPLLLAKMTEQQSQVPLFFFPGIKKEVQHICSSFQFLKLKKWKEIHYIKSK